MKVARHEAKRNAGIRSGKVVSVRSSRTTEFSYSLFRRMAAGTSLQVFLAYHQGKLQALANHQHLSWCVAARPGSIFLLNRYSNVYIECSSAWPIHAHSPLECCLCGSFVRWWGTSSERHCRHPVTSRLAVRVDCTHSAINKGGDGVTAVTPFF